MLGKLFKWLSSDRSEEPIVAPPEVGILPMGEIREALARQSVRLDERHMKAAAQLIAKRQKIEAIKLIREESKGPLGLKEAKDAADAMAKILKA
jgi:ribosomal protein L7/L12